MIPITSLRKRNRKGESVWMAKPNQFAFGTFLFEAIVDPLHRNDLQLPFACPNILAISIEFYSSRLQPNENEMSIRAEM
jgi:hypothetical protein